MAAPGEEARALMTESKGRGAEAEVLKTERRLIGSDERAGVRNREIRAPGKGEEAVVQRKERTGGEAGVQKQEGKEAEVQRIERKATTN